MKNEFKLAPESQRELNRSIQKLAFAAGKTARDVIIPQARLFCVDLAFNTDRRGKKASVGVKHREDIKNRISSTYVFVGGAVNMLKKQSEGKAIAFQKALKKKDFTEAARIMNLNFSDQWTVGPFDDGKLHDQQRNEKKIRRKMVVTNKGALTKYKNKKAKNAGFAKSAFAAAARDLGGVRGIPKFANDKNAPGGAVTVKKGFDLRITITNGVKYIRDALGKSGEATAVSFRQRQITKQIKQMATRRFKNTSKSLK